MRRASGFVLFAIFVGSMVGCVGAQGAELEDERLGTSEQSLNALDCATGGGTDYTGTDRGAGCRGACGGGCDSDSCSGWSPCVNGAQFQTCWTLPFCQQHDQCYDCCADNGLGSSCNRDCDGQCLMQQHPPCGPPTCTQVCNAYYGGSSYGGSSYGSGSNSSPTCISYTTVCTPNPNDAPNCGQNYTLAECAELAGGYTNSFPEATPIQIDRSCTCIPDGSCSAPPCGVGTDNCGNGCANTWGCGSGYGGSSYGSAY